MTGARKFNSADSTTFADALDLTIAVGLLTIALDGAARSTAGDCTGHGCQLLAVTATYLITQQTTNHCACNGAADAIGVGRILLHFDIVAAHARAVVELTAFICFRITVLTRMGLGLREGARRHQADQGNTQQGIAHLHRGLRRSRPLGES
ncbi:hypothetical protein XGA_4379 [Xanthomonas hortorum ATCC 19865]|nr:hypothetical protein XGA_4379 [Xanthomonas hortorum ATCC 19865]